MGYGILCWDQFLHLFLRPDVEEMGRCSCSNVIRYLSVSTEEYPVPGRDHLQRK